jgi:hypothetical protein
MVVVPKRIDLGDIQDLEGTQFVVHVGSTRVVLLAWSVRANLTLDRRRIVEVEVSLNALDSGSGDDYTDSETPDGS